MLAEDDDEMVSFLRNHLIDVQNTGPNKMPWKFVGAWKQKGRNHFKHSIKTQKKKTLFRIPVILFDLFIHRT